MIIPQMIPKSIAPTVAYQVEMGCDIDAPWYRIKFHTPIAGIAFVEESFDDKRVTSVFVNGVELLPTDFTVTPKPLPGDYAKVIQAVQVLIQKRRNCVVFSPTDEDDLL